MGVYSNTWVDENNKKIEQIGIGLDFISDNVKMSSKCLLVFDSLVTATNVKDMGKGNNILCAGSILGYVVKFREDMLCSDNEV